MKKNKQPLSIRLIYILTNVFFGFYILSFAIGIGFVIAIQFDMLPMDFQIHTSLPVMIEEVDKGVVTIMGKQIDVEIVQAYGKIHFKDTPPFLVRILSISLLIALSLGFFLMFVFRKFIVNVKNGDYFELKNIRLIKYFSYGISIIWLFYIIYVQWFKFYIINELELESKIVSHDIDFKGEILMIALVIWVLSHVFQKGRELQLENELTV